MAYTLYRLVGRARRAMTLVELLVVMALISILAGLLLPAVQQSREAARRIGCSNNMRQVALALANYETQFGAFPMGCMECRPPSFPPPPWFKFKRISWNAFVLPYLEQRDVHEQLHFDLPFHAQANQFSGGTVISTFLCPSTATTSRGGPTSGDRNGNGLWDPGDDLAYTDYAGLYGVSFNLPQVSPNHEGVMLYDRAIRASEILDGLSNTALVGECTGRDYRQQSEWINGHNLFDQRFDNPINASQDNELFSDHPQGCFVAFCDGHIAFLHEQMDQKALIALLTRAGGEVASGL